MVANKLVTPEEAVVFSWFVSLPTVFLLTLLGFDLSFFEAMLIGGTAGWFGKDIVLKWRQWRVEQLVARKNS